MAVKSVNQTLKFNSEYNLQKNEKQQNKHYTPSFQGFGNPITVVMDAIDRGGFAASFIAQDGIGMVAPRIWEGLNRNRKREKDPVTGEETGKKTGPLNWEFARREGIREILSGPSAFIIPAIMLAGIKKWSGTANNVHVDHINALGKSFADFAETNADVLDNIAKAANGAKEQATLAAKEKFYEKVFKNVLSTSLENKLTADELAKTAQEFTKEYINIENAPSKGHWKTFIGKAVPESAEDLQGALTDRYMNLRKKLLPSSINEMDAGITVEGTNKVVKTNFSKILSSLSDYSNDVLKNAPKFIEKHGTEDLEKFLKNFNSRRIGTRIVSIVSMFAAVVGFYTIIPKLYNLGLKHDPGLAGLEDETSAHTQQPQQPQQAQQQKTEKAADIPAKDVKPEAQQNADKNDKNTNKTGDVAFTGAFQTASRRLGEIVNDSAATKKVIDKFEFNGPSMSVPAMLTLLFGFCLPPRYKNAKSDKERKEILVRDISSFSAILFGANALSRLTSDAFGKTFGLVLNVKPQDHNKSIFHQVKNYLTPGKGIDVLKGAQIDSKYSNLEGYKDRIVGFVDFLENNDGNAKKVFKMDKGLRTEVETILGKPLKEVSIDDLKKELKAADDELLKGLDLIKNMDNGLRAKVETILGKPLKEASIDDLKKVFEAIDERTLNAFDFTKASAMQKIYAKFGPNNKFINIAKTCNSTFGFLSTIVLVPLFMIGIARYCENMTKKRVAQEKAERAAEAAKNAPMANLKNMLTHVMPSQKPSMTGFLKESV